MKQPFHYEGVKTMGFKNLKNMSLIWWITELIAITLTLIVCFYCVWLCIPALFTQLLLTQKFAMIIGYAVICYACGRLFTDVKKVIRKRIRKLKR